MRCKPASQHTYCPLNISWIRLHTTAAAEGGVRRELRQHTVHSVSVGFTYTLQQRRRGMLVDSSAHILTTIGWIHLLPTAAAKRNVSRQRSTHTVRSISVGFSYFLQQRWRGMLADSGAHILSTPSRLDSLTSYSSGGGRC